MNVSEFIVTAAPKSLEQLRVLWGFKDPFSNLKHCVPVEKSPQIRIESLWLTNKGCWTSALGNGIWIFLGQSFITCQFIRKLRKLPFNKPDWTMIMDETLSENDIDLQQKFDWI